MSFSEFYTVGVMDAKPTDAFKRGVKKNGKENQLGDYDATNLAFNRLGAILHEIAKNAIDNSNSTESEEGGIKNENSGRRTTGTRQNGY